MFDHDDYQAIFNTRADAYHEAMLKWPHARDSEFNNLLKDLSLTSGMNIIDVPSGGGYLANYLPTDIHLHHLETSELFAELCHSGSQHKLSLCQLDTLPVENHSIDLALSLAGLHHIEDKKPLFGEIFRALKPGGIVKIADVYEQSPTAKFLDGWMSKNNSMGHHGWYLNERTMQQLQGVGYQNVRAKQESYYWKFTSESDAAAYCKKLFGINLATQDEVSKALKHNLGFINYPTGEVGLNWQLLYISAEKPT